MGARELRVHFKQVLGGFLETSKCGLVALARSKVLKSWNVIKRCQLLKDHDIKSDIKGPGFSLSRQLWNQISLLTKQEFSCQPGGLNLEPRNQAVFFLVLTMSLRVNYHQDASPAHIRDPGKQPPCRPPSVRMAPAALTQTGLSRAGF